MSRGGDISLSKRAAESCGAWSYVFNGKEKLLSYGPYPFVKLAQSRELHAAARALLNQICSLWFQYHCPLVLPIGNDPFLLAHNRDLFLLASGVHVECSAV